MIFDIEKIKPEDRKSKKRIKTLTQFYEGKYNIAKGLKYNFIIEIGVDTGHSALAFLTANPNASYVGFDNDSYALRKGFKDDRLDWAKGLLKNFKDVKIIVKDTQEMQSLGYRADLIHVDGCHSTKCIYHDLGLATLALNEGGVIIVDDYDYQQRVRDGVDWFLEDYLDYSGRYVKTVRGDMVITKNKNKIKRVHGFWFRYREGSHDAAILRYEMKKNEYKIENPKVVIDIGAHIGGTSILCASGGATVYSYEPEPDNFRFLRANVKMNNLGDRIRCFQRAVGIPGKRKLYLNEENTGSYSLQEKTDKSVEVEVVSLKSIFEDNSVEYCDLLKSDCQGGEYEFLWDAPFERIGQVSIELHGEMEKQFEMIEHLKKFYRVEVDNARKTGIKMAYCYKK